MNARAPASGDTLGGKYVVEGLIGRGGMGAVYRARHAITDRPVALKWLLPGVDQGDLAVQRFLREARAMGRIDHPNVVGVLDFGSEHGSAWMAMELLRGRALRAHVAEGHRLGAAEAIALLAPAMEGVAAAHRVGVIHRDLKPENLFVVEDEEGRPRTTKVLDFGISKVHEDPSKIAPITQTGTTMGTPSYMAPEQVRGAKDIDARADVWSLAVILYELLSGQTPFHAETYGGLMVAICMEPHVPVAAVAPDVPRELSRVIDRALAKDPAERYPDVPALVRALAPFAAPVSLAAVGAAAGVPATEPSDGGAAHPTATPTRPVKNVAAGREISLAPTAVAAPVELDSQAQRRPAARSGASNPSVPLSVPDLPSRAQPPPRRTIALVAALAIAALVPTVAVIANESMRPQRATSPATSAPGPSVPEPAAAGPAAAGPAAAGPAAAGPAAAGPSAAGPSAAEPSVIPSAPVVPAGVAPSVAVVRDAGVPAAIVASPAAPVTPAPVRAPRARRVEPVRPSEAAPVTPAPPDPSAPPVVRGRTGQLSREEF